MHSQSALARRNLAIGAHVKGGQVMPERPPIQQLLRDATSELDSIDTADVAAVLQAAWHGICAAGAAGTILEICGDPGQDPARWVRAEPGLSAAVRALRAAPSLRGVRSAALNPAGSPKDHLDDAEASAIRHGIVEVAQSLSAGLPKAAQQARAKGDRRACRVAAAAGRELADCYVARRNERVPDEAAVARPARLQVRDLGELQQLVDQHVEELYAVDPARTAVALTTAWYGFVVAACLGQFLAARDADLAVLHDNATPVIARFVAVLESAPSLPADVHGAGLDTEGDATAEMMRTAHQGILRLVLALNTLFPKIAETARRDADCKAAREATRLSSELGDCYQGRLRTFLG